MKLKSVLFMVLICFGVAIIGIHEDHDQKDQINHLKSHFMRSTLEGAAIGSFMGFEFALRIREFSKVKTGMHSIVSRGLFSSSLPLAIGYARYRLRTDDAHITKSWLQFFQENEDIVNESCVMSIGSMASFLVSSLVFLQLLK